MSQSHCSSHITSRSSFQAPFVVSQSSWQSAFDSFWFAPQLKRFRAIATRFEKTARNFLALAQLACAWLWLDH